MRGFQHNQDKLERIGKSNMFNERDMVEFNEFIDSMGLVDVP